MTTSTIKTDSNNDLVLDSSGNLTILNGIVACTQDVRAASLMRTGEDVLDVEAGVNYFDYIFTPQPNYDRAKKSLTTAILSSPDTVSIEQLTVDIDGSNFVFEAEILTTYGPLVVSN